VSWEPRTPREGINVSSTHPLAELALGLAGVAAVVLVLFALAGVLVEAVLPRIPGRTEARWFGELWSEAVAEPSPRAARAEALLQRLARHWPQNPYALHLQVLDQEAPNALALPGGGLAVTNGLLDCVGSENELAFVLGHELGHLRHRDPLRRLGRSGLARLGLAVITGQLDAAPAWVAGLTEAGYARRQEREADRFGLALVAREYGHVAGASDFLQRLEAEAPGWDARVAGWWSTHPLGTERIAALAAAAREEGWAAEGPLTALDPPR